MSYTVYDFSESLARLNKVEHGFDRGEVKRVLAAWGGSPEGGGSWSGGFLLALDGDRTAYVTGWRDYTGWGCQDGIETKIIVGPVELETLENTAWDQVPVDLNRYLTGEIDHLYESNDV